MKSSLRGGRGGGLAEPGRFLLGEPPSHLKRPPLKIQPVLAREGKPSVDVDKLASLLDGSAVLCEMERIKSREHWSSFISGLGGDIDAILPVSSPCYPTEIWNSCPEPLVERKLPVLFWPLIEFDEPDFWKWSARDMLRSLGVEVFLVKSNAQGLSLAKALAMRRFLREAKLVVFGEQNFPWNAFSAWSRIEERLGAKTIVKPLSSIRERQGRFSDSQLDALWASRRGRYEVESTRPDELRAALRSYMAIKSILDEEKALGFGVNCFGDLIPGGGRDVPCLAQCLAREDGYIASCDGDFCAMASMALASVYLDKPCMMSNMYPLNYVGALREHFGDPLQAPSKFKRFGGNLARLAHCGFAGIVPPEMSESGKATLKDWGGTYEIKRDGRGCGVDSSLSAGRRFTAVELRFDGRTVLLAGGKVLESSRHKGMPHCEASALLAFDDLEGFVENISREHVVLLYGDLIPELVLLCETLGLDAKVF